MTSPGAMPNVVIVLARCSRDGQPYGMRVEEKSPGQWYIDWAFPIQDAVAGREGYGSNEIRGSFAIEQPGFPGCPHCGGPSFFKCGCGKMTCWDGSSRSVTCRWCGGAGELSSGSIESMDSGGDR